MKPPRDDQPAPLSGREALRLIGPAFAVSAVVVVAGFVLIAARHQTIGVILLVVGAVGGFAVRARIMMRQQTGRPPRR